MEKNKSKTTRTLGRKIINGFIVFFSVIVVFLLIFFGFSQTSTFREYLRTTITNEVNSTINGELKISSIEGTILTSLILRDVQLEVDSSTLFQAEKLEIVATPHKLIFKVIHFRNIEFSNVNINLIEDENGIPLISKLTKQTEQTDTIEIQQSKEPSEPFSFFVQVDNLKLNKINFVSQTKKYVGSDEYYNTLNSSDLRIKDFDIKAKGFADLKNSTIGFVIDKLSAKPNFKNFNLKNLSGKFLIANNFAEVKNLSILTGNTDINLSAKLDSLSLLSDIELKEFNEYPLYLQLDAQKFDFDALTSFIEDTQMLKGKAKFYLDAKGQFGKFDINRLNLNFGNSEVNLHGKLNNLHTPENLFIDAEFDSSTIILSDVKKLLPLYSIPDYKYVDLLDFDGKFVGKPTNFDAEIDSKLNKGSISLDAKLNLEPEEMIYDVKLITNQTDFESLVGYPTSLNSFLSVKGTSADPAKMNSKMSFSIYNSSFNNYSIDSLFFNSTGEYKLLEFNATGNIENTLGKLDGIVDFADENKPVYSFSSVVKNLNLATYLKDKNYESNLNFKFDLKGEELHIDSTVSEFVMAIENSIYKGKKIDSTDIEMYLTRDNSQRSIKMISDFLDFELNGEFSIQKAAKALSYQSSTITETIKTKLDEFNPVNVIENQDSISTTTKISIPDYAAYPMKLNYSLKFKNLDLISIILDEDLHLEGSGKGIIENNANNFKINTNLDIKTFSMIKENSIYLSESDLKFNFSKSLKSQSFDDLFGTITLNGKRFYFGKSLKNFGGDFVFNQSKLFFNLFGSFEDELDSEIEGNLVIQPNEQSFNISYSWFKYKDISWEADSVYELVYSPESFKINNFNLSSGISQINIDGTIFNNGKQDFSIVAKNINERVLTNYIPSLKPSNLTTNSNLSAQLKGTLNDPIIKVEHELNNITFEDVNFGSFLTKMDYKEKRLESDIVFVDKSYDLSNPKLHLVSSVPIDLSFTSQVEERIDRYEDFKLELKSNNFDLETFGNTLPIIKNQKGKLESDIILGGNLNELNYDGFVLFPDLTFTARANNLRYKLRSKLRFDYSKANIEELIVQNTSSAKNVGKMEGTGSVRFSGFEPTNIDFSLDGDLTVLSQKSKEANPNIYGDLFIESDGDIVYSYENGKSYMEGAILINEADIIYANNQKTLNSDFSNFNYTFVVDSSKIDREEIRFRKMLAENEKITKERQEAKQKVPEFDFDFYISTQTQASMTFIISESVSQKLNVDVIGDFVYSSNDGITRAQGEFEIMNGSTLDIVKTFEADGRIRFESDITDPFLDIIATYRGLYYPPTESTSPEEVAVELSINGPLSNLSKILSSNPQNIKVYRGANNIDNKVADPQLDAADAFTFILTGRFKSEGAGGDMNLNEELTNLATNSLLGTVFTNLANSMVGNLINSVQVKESGLNRKYSVSGRYKNFRYIFGGKTNEFNQDFIDNAEIRVDYLVSPKFLIRMERRLPLINSFGSDQYINELGLKYKFEF